VTRFFFDTEFIEDGKTIDLISIAIVADSGPDYYAISQEADLTRASPWVRQNVLPHLPPYGDPHWTTREIIKKGVEAFVLTHSDGKEPEFWAYYADYDWVALCQLFGTMMDLPESWPMYCMDLKQLSVMKGSPTHPPGPKDLHDALADAHWNKRLFDFLMRGHQ
jgi:hypothetical protein